MTTWKRWPWSYRVGVLFALALLLQGASCPYIDSLLPRYQVPGIGAVIAQRYYNAHTGQHYFKIDRPETLAGKTYYGESYCYEGSEAYQTIDTYFRVHTELQVADFDRSAIPGGAASLPPLAAQ